MKPILIGWRITSFIRRPDGNGTIRFNGTELLTQTTGPTFIDLYTPEPANIFRSAHGLEARELIIFKRALSQLEIDDVESYLSNKWNIPLTY
jgi:hypothetical protein